MNSQGDTRSYAESGKLVQLSARDSGNNTPDSNE